MVETSKFLVLRHHNIDSVHSSKIRSAKTNPGSEFRG